jgi:ABC-type multidrug transport system ATPase subunit/ABC-type multidrug transport system permease subunit
VLKACDVEVSVADGVRILGPVSLDVAQGKLVALMGPSGSGKSTLLRVLAGVALADAGSATWLAEPTTAAAQSLGYVPQRESIHDRLTTREAFRYAACLRLDPGASVEGRVDAVLGELGLVEQADTLVLNLSGGERRRAACGLELVGAPHVLLLDEPTSGLDMVLERRLMELFRQLADHGRAVVVVTHATASLDLCDEVIVMEKGVAAHRGSPTASRAYLRRVADGRELEAQGAPGRPAQPGPVLAAPRPVGLELRVLAARYSRTLTRDRRTLALLLGQAPVLGFLIGIVFHPQSLGSGGSPTDAVEFVFMLMTGSIWLGVASACREVVKERGLVEREFDVGVRLDAYVLSKALVLFALTFVQVVLFTAVVLTLQPPHIGLNATLQLLLLSVLTAWTSAGTGLAVSCLTRTVDQAAGVVPLLLMPQLLFAGALIPLAQMPRLVSALADLTYARWSYAGLGTTFGIENRLAQFGGASALGFSSTFFTLRFGVAALTLIGFTMVELFAATYFLRVRPSPNP